MTYASPPYGEAFYLWRQQSTAPTAMKSRNHLWLASEPVRAPRAPRRRLAHEYLQQESPSSGCWDSAHERVRACTQKGIASKILENILRTENRSCTLHPHPGAPAGWPRVVALPNPGHKEWGYVERRR